MRVATLDVTAELLCQFAMASQHQGGLPRRFFVKENPLPDDVRVLSVHGTEAPGVIQLLLQSETFEDVLDGEKPPHVPDVIYQTVYDDPHDYCKGGCGIDFNEFPDMRHSEDECGGPECTCYEITGGHQMGCYFYGRAVQ